MKVEDSYTKGTTGESQGDTRKKEMAKSQDNSKRFMK